MTMTTTTESDDQENAATPAEEDVETSNPNAAGPVKFEGLNFQSLETSVITPKNSKTRSKISKRQSVYADIAYVPGIKIRLFSPPRQRQKWGSDQVLPHVNWGDLFFDLFYVAAFYNLGNILVGDPSWIGIFYFLACFFSIYLMWVQKMRYDSQFTYGDDLFHKFFEAVFLVVLAANISFIHTVPQLSNPSKHIDMFGFSLTLTVLTVMNCIRYLECYWYGRGQRKNIKHVTMSYIQFQVAPLVCYSASTIIAGMAYFGNTNDDNHRRHMAEAYDETTTDNKEECYKNMKMHIPMILVLAGYLAYQLWMIIKIVWLYPTNGKHKKTTIPMNLDFVIHRLGELTMLVLGESILSLLIVKGKTANHHKIFYFGIVTVIVMQMLHFRSQPHDADAHAMRRHKNSGVLFAETFALYSAALIAVGASYKLLLYSVSESDYGGRRLHADEPGIRWLAAAADDSGCGPSAEKKKDLVAHLFSKSMAVVFVCLDVMLLAHVGLKKEVEKCRILGSTCENGTRKMQYNVKGVLFVVLPRGAITLFIATLSQWMKDPSTLAGIGMASVMCQLMTRFLGNIWLPDSDFSLRTHGDRHHGGISDDEEEESESDVISEGIVEDNYLLQYRTSSQQDLAL